MVAPQNSKRLDQVEGDVSITKIKVKAAAADQLEYHSSDDLDYHPDLDAEEEEEDFNTEEDSELNDSDEDGELEKVFDKPKKDGVCSSSSSVSLDQPEVEPTTSNPKFDTKILHKKLQEEVGLFLSSHKQFNNFIHKHEIPRKFLHVSIGFVTLYFYTINWTTKMFIAPLTTAFLIIFSIDLYRFRHVEFNKLYCKTVGFLMREKEVNSYNGVIWYLLGLSIAFYPFSKDIGVMAVLLLSWSDTAASTVGRAYGYLTPKIARNKSLAGSFAAFVSGVLSCLFFYGFVVPKYGQQDDPEIAWSPAKSYMSLTSYSIACGFIAAVSEGIDILDWDDNFTIPVLSSVFLHGLLTVTAK